MSVKPPAARSFWTSAFAAKLPGLTMLLNNTLRFVNLRCISTSEVDGASLCQEGAVREL